MTKRRYTAESVFEFDVAPELVLNAIVTGVQSDELREQRSALLALLGPSGPWQSTVTLNRFWTRASAPSADAFIAAECYRLVALLRELVRARDLGSATPRIFFAKNISMQAISVPGGLRWDIDSDDIASVVTVKLARLLDVVGLDQVRECSADDCTNLYIKHHRRTHCSVRCEKRQSARRRRREAAQQRQQQQARTKGRRASRS